MKSSPSPVLGDVAAFIRGVTFTPQDVLPAGSAGSVACMRTKNVQAHLDTSDVLSVPASVIKRSDQYLERGDILVSSANSWNLVGKCSWVPNLPGPATFGGFVTALRADASLIDQRYLYWWFSSPRVQGLVRSFGRKTTSISNLDLRRCQRLQVPLPPLREQQRIAQVMDAADAIRVRRTEALVKTSALPSAFLKMMLAETGASVATRELGPLSAVITKGTTPTTLGRSYATSGIPFLRAHDLEVAYVSPDDVVLCIDLATHQLLSRSRVLPGDVLISIAGTIGRSAIVPPRTREMNCNQAVAIVRPNEGLLPEFLQAWLESADAQRQMRASSVTGTISNLSLSQLRSLKVPLPALEHQQDFVRRDTAIRRFASRMKVHRSHLESLFASLQHRAFAGEL